LHSLDAPIVAPARIDLCLAGVNIRIKAPEPVASVLNATLANVPRFRSDAAGAMTIAVTQTAEAWEIRGFRRSSKVLAWHSSLPQIGGAVVSMAMASAALRRDCMAVRATVLEHDGRALALVGDDWESALTLATHLHARGWSYVGSDNALLDPATRTVYGVQKSLYVNSSSVLALPVTYRRAVEASPWYVTPQGISFYAVDPTGAGTGLTWASQATLCSVIIVDGAMADIPALDSADSESLRADRFARLALDWATVDAAELCLAGVVETCDLIEHWFSSLAR
jgi:hypothetical protein